MSASQVHTPGLSGESGARILQFPAAIAKIRSLGFKTRLADAVFRWLMLLCAASVPAIVALIAVELVSESRMSLHASGWQFFMRQIWDPVSGEFGALSFIYGTL